MDYPIRVELHENGTCRVSFPDFPGAHTIAASESEALAQAGDVLMAILHGCVRDHRDIPAPSCVAGARQVAVPALVAAKVSLYVAMRAARVNQSELARRMAVHAPQVRRLLDVRHGSQLEQLEAAFHALGKRLVVGIEELTAPLLSGGRTAARRAALRSGRLDQPAV